MTFLREQCRGPNIVNLLQLKRIIITDSSFWHWKGGISLKIKKNKIFRNLEDRYEITTLTNRLTKNIKPNEWKEGKFYDEMKH